MICPSPAKGKGVAVAVGEGVLEGIGVEVFVAVGGSVSVAGSGEGVGSACVKPQAVNKPKDKKIKSLEDFINPFLKGEKYFPYYIRFMVIPRITLASSLSSRRTCLSLNAGS